jgi:anaerobic ribonucleoside-triphosphate reductase activating protein
MDKPLFVGGVVSVSTIDYPGYISAVVFLQGCPWRCSYCHNQHLQTILQSESLPWEDVINLLKSRVNFVEAVVFSGGEPLAQEALLDAILDVKDLGFLVGLHTAGAVPRMLAKTLPCLDWIGFDVKHDFKNYHLITNVNDSGSLAYESLQMAIASNVDLEVRMTMDESIETSSAIDVMKELASMGVKTIVLQKCRNKDEIIVEHPIFSDKLLLEDISGYFDNFFIR